MGRELKGTGCSSTGPADGGLSSGPADGGLSTGPTDGGLSPWTTDDIGDDVDGGLSKRPARLPMLCIETKPAGGVAIPGRK